jgi:hypothetical protein
MQKRGWTGSEVLRIAAIVYGVRPGSPGWDAPWVVKPQLGDLFDTSREEALRVLYEELAVLGRFHSIAVLMRGAHDPWTSDMPKFRRVAESYALPSNVTPPAWELFVDTGSWHHAAADGVFDCGSQQHWSRAWNSIISPWFDIFGSSSRLERLPDGRVPVMLWSIAPGLRFERQQYAGDMLDYFETLLEDHFGIRVAWHVDQSFLEHAPGGDYWAVNAWFDPNVSGHTVRRHHNGVTIGVVVPGFHDPPHVPPNERRILDRRNGQTLRDGFEACRAARCDRVYVEGYTGWEEQTLCMVTDVWGTRELDTIRTVTTTEGESGMYITDGSKVVFEAEANGKLVCAENAGTQPLIANRIAPGPWETFKLRIVSGGAPAPRSAATTIRLEDIEGAFSYQDTIKYAAPGDVAAIERIFGLSVDQGDLQQYRNGDWTWRRFINPMLERAT